MTAEENPPLKVLIATLEYKPMDDAEERLLEIFEYLLIPEKTLDLKKE
jgi:hypothetical protein